MDKYNKRNNRESNNITDEKNNDKNIKNDIFKTKIKANNKKEEDKIFIYQSSINKIKPEFDNNSNKKKKKIK